MKRRSYIEYEYSQTAQTPTIYMQNNALWQQCYFNFIIISLISLFIN